MFCLGCKYRISQSKYFVDLVGFELSLKRPGNADWPSNSPVVPTLKIKHE